MSSPVYDDSLSGRFLIIGKFECPDASPAAYPWSVKSFAVGIHNASEISRLLLSDVIRQVVIVQVYPDGKLYSRIWMALRPDETISSANVIPEAVSKDVLKECDYIKMVHPYFVGGLER